MIPPELTGLYTEVEFESKGTHDSYVYGIRWNLDDSALMFDLDYIAKWFEPASTRPEAHIGIGYALHELKLTRHRGFVRT